MAENHPDAETLLKVIYDRAEQDKQQIEAQGRDDVAKINAETRAAIERIRADARRQAEQAIGRERDRLLGKAQADQRLAIHDIKRELVHDTFARAEKGIRAARKSDSYRQIVSALIREGLEVTGPDSRLEVADSESALCRAVIKEKGLACVVQSTQARAGTFVMTSADGQRRVDNSLQTRLARARFLCLPDITRILFQDRVNHAGKDA